jgi:hypothetical protein
MTISHENLEQIVRGYNSQKTEDSQMHEIHTACGNM